MAVHNGEQFLPAAVESILGQTYHGWELIVVDDGSTDASGAILRSFAEREPRVRVIEHQNKRGLARSLNDAFACAQGELIARMDADDVSLPQRLERQVQFLDAHPEIDVLGTSAELIGATGHVFGVVQRPERHQDLAETLYRGNPILHPSAVMRRDFLKTLGGYDEKLSRAQDADLWLRGHAGHRFHNLQEPLLRYRYRSPSVKAILIGSFVLARAAHREGRLLSRGPLALRFLFGALLRKARAEVVAASRQVLRRRRPPGPQ